MRIIKNPMDTQIVKKRNDLYIINSKAILLNRWWRHRLSDAFTKKEKKDFEEYLLINNI